jgi:hypothetical protein
MGFNDASSMPLRISLRPSSTARETWVRMRSEASTCLKRWDFFSLIKSLRNPDVFGPRDLDREGLVRLFTKKKAVE